MQYIILIMIFGFHTLSFGQTNFPIKMAFSNEATAIPFTKILTKPIHPSFQIGTEYYYNIGLHYDFYQTASVGYIFHNHLYQGIYINTGIGYDYKLPIGLKLKSNIEIGYIHTFATQDEFQFKNGHYVNNPDKGNSRFMPMVSLGLGHIIKKEKQPKSEIYLMYKSWVEYPYSPGFISTMAHINLEVGYKIYLDRK